MYVAIAGNIGAGKTTLVGKLARYYGFKAEYEAVDENPYLKDFYQDMERWAFPLQICFLSHRFKQGLMIKSSQQGIILDRTIYEDAEIFAKNLYQSGYLSERDYQNYLFLYNTMIELIPSPNLLIYLKGNTELLTQRIRQRSFEKKISQNNEEFIPIDYLNNLNIRYNQWIEHFDLCPIITLDIEQYDLNKPGNFNLLTKKLDSFLK